VWRLLLAGFLFVAPKKKFVCEIPSRRPAFVRHALPVGSGGNRSPDLRSPLRGAPDAAFCDSLFGHAMTKWANTDLKREFQKVVDCGWMPYFQSTAKALDLPSELLLAIASRETGMSNVPGDFHNGQFHGFGIMQVDRGTDEEWCCAWHPDKVKESIVRGAEILAEKRAYLAKKKITDWKAIAAAYNAGQGEVVQMIKAGKNPDLATKGGNYGSDVFARSMVFAELLVVVPKAA
jgi:hypothetical protein